MTRVRDWPAGSPRILVTDAWLPNAGDGAIALAADVLLRELAPEASVLHAAYHEDVLHDAYRSLALVPPIVGLLGISPEQRELAGWDPTEARELAEGADLVVSAGGGFFMEPYGQWARMRAFEMLAEMGIPFVFLAHSIGPYEASRERGMLRRILRAAVGVGVREEATARNVAEIAARTDVVMVGDIAVTLFPDPPRPRDASGIALVLTPHPVFGADGSIQEPAASADRIVRLIEGAAEAAGPEGVTLFSSAQGVEGALEDDAIFSKTLLERCHPKVRAHARVIDRYLGPWELAGTIVQHRALVSMRMHPVLLGMSVGVPSLLLTGAFKAAEMFPMLGVGDAIVAGLDGVEEALERLPVMLGADVLRGEQQWERLQPARERATEGAERVLAPLLGAAS